MSVRPDRIDLRPADIHVAVNPTVIITVLGSCVAICLLGDVPGTGAMCHSLLPSGCAHKAEDRGRFVDEALEAMIFRLWRLGVPHSALRAKLFGGADMFGLESGEPRRPSVGRQNVGMARRLLAERGIPLVAENTGGTQGRKIFFHTDSGEVRLRWLGQQAICQAA